MAEPKRKPVWQRALENVLWKTEELGQQFEKKLRRAANYYGFNEKAKDLFGYSTVEEAQEAATREGNKQYMRAMAENPNPTVSDIVPVVGTPSDYLSRLVELDKQKVRSSERAREIVEETRKLELEAGYLPEDLTALPDQLTRSILRSSELPEGSFDVQPWDRHPSDPLYQPPPPRGVAPNTGIAPQSFPPQQQWAPPMLEEFRRLDGTVKGDGYLGQVATNGGYMTELSAGLPGTEEGFYPLLGPWLDENEVATLQRGGQATPEMYRKARMAAEERKLVGQPVFAPPGYSSGPVLEQPANQGAKSDGKNSTGKKGRSR